MEQAMDASRLRREVHPIPDFIAQAFEERGLTAAYRARPCGHEAGASPKGKDRNLLEFQEE